MRDATAWLSVEGGGSGRSSFCAESLCHGRNKAARRNGLEKEVKRVKMTVAYDGTNYKGWQVQPNGITIEEVLNRHLSSLLGEEIAVTGASRTDSGVHSLGNVAIFDTTTRMPADKISFALNPILPYVRVE